MYRKLIAAGLVMTLGTACDVIAQEAEAPQISSWSNSKTADQKTVFAVKPGEKITFAIKADGAEKYLWLVDGAVQGKAKGASFTWTVPDKKGMWKILVKTTNSALEKKDQQEQETLKEWIEKLSGKDIGGGNLKERFKRDMVDLNIYPEKGRKEWIVSTSLTTVKPGESIQKAIDSVPAEGGIVELAPGTHEVNDTLYPPGAFHYAYIKKDPRFKPTKYSILIKRSNVTIYGTRQSIVRHHNSDVTCFFIPDPVDTDPKLRVENITFRGFTTTTAYTKRCPRGHAIIKAHHVKNLTVEDMHDTSRGSGAFVNVIAAPNRARIRLKRKCENVYYKNNTVAHRSLYGYYCNNMYQINNTMEAAGGGWSALGMELRSGNIHVVGNQINVVGRTQFTITVLAGPPGLYNIRNNVCVGGRDGLWIGESVMDALLINNTIRGAGKTGIWTRPQGPNRNVLIINNRIYDCKGYGIRILDHYANPHPPSDLRIINNVIYNVGSDGIFINSPKSHTSIVIANNIIANNKGHGINYVIASKSPVIHNNDVWNNAKGNYKGIAAGKGDISVDPLFTDSAKGNFHLKSKASRWDAKAKKWTKDSVHSPCIDAGDPKAYFGREPRPNGGRINIGAYGNTGEASKSTNQSVEK